MFKIGNFIMQKKNDYERLNLLVFLMIKIHKKVDFFFLFLGICDIILIHCMLVGLVVNL